MKESLKTTQVKVIGNLAIIINYVLLMSRLKKM